jgi:glycosyltransferase involved in cell wall biosynthesis
LRILWLASYAVWPPIHGGKIRTYNLARCLAARGHEVEVWCITDEAESQPSPGLPRLSFRFLLQRPRRSILSKLASLLSPLPTPAWAVRAAPALAALRGNQPFDVAVVEQAQCGVLVPELQQAGLRWVFDTQNVEWWLSLQISRRLRSPVTRLRFALDALKFKRLETRLLRTATAVVAVSAEDATRLRALEPSKPIDICPNGVDMSYFNFTDHSVPRGAGLVMTGTLGYYPNLDAGLWLVNEILPRIRLRLPDARVELVGGGVTAEVKLLDRPEAGVTVVGQVPDVRPHLAAADVFVMPLRLGSGTRLKALEALASGLPIVATPLAVEGLGLVDREHVLLGETADELAAAVELAITDLELRSRLVEGGRRYVLDRFDWDRIAADFETMLERVAT